MKVIKDLGISYLRYDVTFDRDVELSPHFYRPRERIVISSYSGSSLQW